MNSCIVCRKILLSVLAEAVFLDSGRRVEGLEGLESGRKPKTSNDSARDRAMLNDDSPAAGTVPLPSLCSWKMSLLIVFFNTEMPFLCTAWSSSEFLQLQTGVKTLFNIFYDIPQFHKWCIFKQATHFFPFLVLIHWNSKSNLSIFQTMMRILMFDNITTTYEQSILFRLKWVSESGRSPDTQVGLVGNGTPSVLGKQFNCKSLARDTNEHLLQPSAHFHASHN